jgi:hypothetical protein
MPKQRDTATPPHRPAAVLDALALPVKVLAAQLANEINHAATALATAEPGQEPPALPAPKKATSRKKS